MHIQKYFYVFQRTDLPVADQICQVAHACLEAGSRFNYPANTFLVLLEIESEEALLELQRTIEQNGINTFANYEPDDDLGFTCLVTMAITQEQRKLFRKHKLWKAPPVIAA